ncbi:MAG: DUF5674 family protein [bacterium]|nr:DUF5674 family protein [bacterium]
MILIDKSITKEELNDIAKGRFGNLVKGVVDVTKQIMVIDANLHADEEAELLSKGSSQADLWGINLYPDLDGEDFLEFDSMINLKPGSGNMSRGVDDPKIQSQIRNIVNKLVK